MRTETLVSFVLSCTFVLIALAIFAPTALAGVPVANLDPVQVQMLLESYREQISMYKIGFGTVCGAETSAIVWLAKRLLDAQAQIVAEVKGKKD